MTSRRFAAWQKVVALAPLLLLAVYLPGQMMLRCRIDGGPILKAQDCCARELSATDRPVVEAAQLSGVDSAWTVAAALPALAVSIVRTDFAPSARGWQAQGPPGEGPPLVLLKHAFLI
jgi:hypothetical protein